jgi:hypothetical protein
MYTLGTPWVPPLDPCLRTGAPAPPSGHHCYTPCCPPNRLRQRFIHHGTRASSHRSLPHLYEALRLALLLHKCTVYEQTAAQQTQNMGCSGRGRKQLCTRPLASTLWSYGCCVGATGAARGLLSNESWWKAFKRALYD